MEKREVPRNPEIPADIPEYVSNYHKVVYDGNKKIEKAISMQNQYGVTLDDAFTYINYLENLHLAEKDVLGKKVLDVGSAEGGFKKMFERLNGQTADIVNMDARHSKSVDVGGRGEALPFKDGAFDTVVAHCSVPVLHASHDQLELIPTTINEMFRVTKKGGVLKVYPIYAYDKNDRKRGLYEEVRKELDRLVAEDPQLKIEMTEFVDVGDDSQDSLTTRSLIVYK